MLNIRSLGQELGKAAARAQWGRRTNITNKGRDVSDTSAAADQEVGPVSAAMLFLCPPRHGDVQIGAGAASPDPVPRTRADNDSSRSLLYNHGEGPYSNWALDLHEMKATTTGFTFKTLY